MKKIPLDTRSSNNFARVFCLAALLLSLIGCGQDDHTVDQSELIVHGVQLYLPFGGQGEHIYTGGDPPIYEWIHSIGKLKLEGKAVYWNDKSVGTVGADQFLVVSGDGEVTIQQK